MTVIDLIEELLTSDAKNEVVIMTGPIEMPKKNAVKAVLPHIEPGKVLVWVGEP
jgi:hypothetical protein